MADLALLTDPAAVDQAIAEFRSIGREDFLRKYGYGKARSFFLVHDGGIYDSKAIVGVAFKYQFGSPLRNEDFSGGEQGAVLALQTLGFRVDRVDDWLTQVASHHITDEVDAFERLGREAYIKAYGGGEAVKYLLVLNGRPYDAKAILVCALRRATGLDGISHLEIQGTESGVAEPLRKLGFMVETKSTSTIGSLIAQILFLNTQYQKDQKAAPMVQRSGLLQQLRNELSDLLSVDLQKLHGHSISIEISHGVGGAPMVPWVRISDKSLSPNAQTGFYVVLLFSADGKRLYLSLNQGTEQANATQIKSRVHWARNQISTVTLPETLQHVTQLPRAAAGISLSSPGRGKKYEAGHIDGFEISAEDLPNDDLVLGGIDFLLAELSILYGASTVSTEYLTDSDQDSRISNLAAELGLQVSFVKELVEGIDNFKRQMILTGPPGTGKTYIAKKLAGLFVSSPDDVQIIQFHPSYGYEDFVEGLRPRPTEEGVFTFERIPGSLVRLVNEAKEDGRVKVLIIDEINRANIPRVFGELMHLLEYRDESILLMLSNETFTLGENIIIIGTMNTADRSIRSLDVAMRRRFRFFEIPPSVDVLKHHYQDTDATNDLGDVLYSGFTALNDRLRTDVDRHHVVGHSFFMRDVMSFTELRKIWTQEISPLLDDYFFDRPDLFETYTFEGFWPVV